MADWLAALTNPLTVAGLGISNPQFGDQLKQAALMKQQEEHAAREQGRYQQEQEKYQREQQLAETLPQILQSVDWSNPQAAQAQLASAGLRPQEIATLFGIFEGQENLGLKQQGLDIERGNLGLRAQEQNFKLKQYEQALEASSSGLLPPEEAAKVEQGLRGEVAKESGEYKVIRDSFKKLEQAVKNPSPAGDISLLFSYMKMLDPKSVVRESEYATAQNAAGVPERIRQQWNKALEGETLTTSQRKDFSKSAKSIFREQAKTYKDTTKQFKDLADRYKVNPKNVVLFEPEEVEEEVPVAGAQDVSGARTEAIRRGLIKE